ncbi:gliding motility-associated ABC transporter substrate-binding protein GldG [Wenyingzhuangia sp. IMCC45533]
MTKKKKYIGLFVVFIVANILISQFSFRIDVTKDHKYSLSNNTKEFLKNINQDVFITVYLTGDLPFDFERLSNETRYLLKDLKNYNSNLKFRFASTKGKEEWLAKQGLAPSRLTVQEDGKVSESIIFPWAIAKSGKKAVPIGLLKNSSFGNETSQIENSIQNLEFALINGIQKATATKKQKIAILKGNGEVKDIYQYDFLKTLGQNYYLAPFTLDSVSFQPKKTLNQLNTYDLAIITKPTEAFTEKEKFVLDQYTISGGKTLWLLDMVHTPKDSLMQNGKVLAYQRDLNLTDYFFNYGVRINKVLVKDLYAAKIPLAVGNVGNKTQFDEFLWDFYPLIKTNNKHVINRNIGDVKLEFTNSIDTLKPNIKKTVLLQSSQLSKNFKVPNFVDLASIANNADISTYNQGSQVLGILLEGEFGSAYKNRVKPFDNNFKAATKTGKMVVIADGDISVNQISKGKPTELGLDKWTNAYYANKEFLTNTVSYLLNDDGLIQSKAKNISIDTINRPKAFKEKTKWQLVNLLIPVAVIIVFAFLNLYYRKSKY